MRRLALAFVVVALSIPVVGCRSAARQIATQVHRDQEVREYRYDVGRSDLYDSARKAAKDAGFKLPKATPDDGESVESDVVSSGGRSAHVTVRIDKDGRRLALEITRVTDEKFGTDTQHRELRDGNLEFATLEAIDPDAAKAIKKDSEKQGRADAEKFVGCAKQAIDS